MVPLDTLAFEGLDSTITTPGDFNSMLDAKTFGPWTIENNNANGIHLLWVFGNGQNFPQYVPGGYNIALWIQISGADSKTNGATATFAAPATVGIGYSVSFWYVARANGQQAPPFFQVTLGGTVVWSNSPNSTSWVRVLIDVFCQAFLPFLSEPSLLDYTYAGVCHVTDGRRQV